VVLTSTRGSLLLKAPPPMCLCRDGFRISRIAGAVLTQAQLLDKRDAAILRAVMVGATTKNAICDRVGGKRQTVLQHIADLIERGHIRDDSGSQSGSQKGPVLVITTSGERLLENLQ